MRQYILLLSLILFYASCDNTSRTKEEDHLIVKVTNSSGDDFSFTQRDSIIYFAPYPFNVGTLHTSTDSPEIMVISKHLDKGKRVAIIPLAKMQVESREGVKKSIFLATPHDEELAIMASTSFDDFIVSQFSLKQIVEFWYSNRYGLQGTRVLGWSPASPDDLEG